FPSTSLSLPRPPPCSTPFPYTTLFRSRLGLEHRVPQRLPDRLVEHPRRVLRGASLVREEPCDLVRRHGFEPVSGTVQPQLAAERSEEHTSELQSRENLVCRLLLEKKKT